MQFPFRIGLSVVLLSAALADWSLISLLFLVGFLTVQYKLRGQVQRGKSCSLLWISLAVAICTILIGLTVVIISAILGTGINLFKYSMLEIIGISRLNPSQDVGSIVLFFVPKIAVGVVASCGLYCEERRTSAEFGSSDNEAFEVRAVLRSFILPTVHVVAGSIFPCWVALPYFICSCTGLFHWSMTSNFVGLSWGWKPLLVYNGAHILLLYVRQLPIPLPDGLLDLADYVGLFRVSIDGMGWLEGLQAISLIALFILLCFAIGDMEDFDCSGLSRVKEVLPVSMMNDDEDNIHESLLQHTSPRETRARAWWDSEQRRVLAFREAAFCFFAYGFPICLVALVCWSFKFESFCALVLLIYVGAILYIFPSLFLLRRLNGMLLGFILLWALSTYIFNAAFTIMTSNFKVDTAIWQTIGLWRYSSPGLFIMAQFALSVLVATDLFVGNNILDNQSEVIREDQNFMEDEPQDRWILSMAVVVWCMHRSADVISLLLIFLVGLRGGLIHAVYMAFFMVYLLSSSVASKTRQYLMLYCELHLGVLYLLQLEWISRIVANHKVFFKPVLSQLGIWNKATFHDYMGVAVLLCFCAVQIHGIKVISSLSAAALQSAETVKRYTPFLLSVSGSHSTEYHSLRSSDENWITKHLAAVGESFRASYRSFGTYIVYATVLAAVYAAKPNYVSFGYLFLLLVWIIGRQILGKTESPFWIPLFVYTCLIFLTRYILSVFPDLQQQLGKFVRLNDDFGFDPKASLFWHLWDSLAILTVMQLYRYERSQLSPVEEPTWSSAFTTNSCKSVDFMKRLLILHSGKILSIAVFYASITPVGGFGLVYLLMLVFTCNMRKSSALPAQLYAVYTGLLTIVEYLFQMFGKETGTYTGQVHGSFVHWLGLRVYAKGVWGTESGVQCKIIVLVACMLQYCSLQWLDQVPAALRRGEEPCLLFHDHGPRGYGSKDPMLGRLQKKVERLDSAFKDERHEASKSLEENGKTSPVLSRLTSRESKKWNRRAMILKQEKYKAQWQALTIWSKYVHEHFFTIYGVEVNMITLLVGGFAVLNIFSLVYVFILALCIMLSNRCIRKLWPCFVFLFACILVGEYAVLADFPPSWNVPPTKNEIHMHCHDCWKNSNSELGFCWKCWLGAVDDRQMLVAYFIVFIISSFQLRANNTSGNSSFHSAGLVATERMVWSEISYETTEQWTWLDHLRFSFYRHLLHVVLLLVFVTGTLQYDLLHLGYLAFSMVFFRMRTTIMKKRNTIFFFLRLYNFSLIIASLIFQAPFFGFLDGRGCTPFSIFGLSKYDYGFRITARSALVDITIFCLVGLQSRIFRTTEFGQVLRYLAAEQVEARAHAQENKAAWKKEQLQRIREFEERKIHRRLQVDKMKMDMVPLQLRLDVLNSAGKVREAFSPTELPESFRRYADDSVVPNTPTRLVNSFSDSALFEHDEGGHGNSVSENTCRRRGKLKMSKDGVRTEPLQTSSSEAMAKRAALGNGSVDEIRQDSHEQVPSPPQVARKHSAKRSLLSGATLFGDGIAQMHNLGNQALANLVGLLNLDHADSDDTSSSSAEDDGKPENEASQTQSQEYISYRDTEVLKPAALSETRHRLSMICRYLWSKVIANTDIVCYVLFVLVYVWNFSLLTLVYPASLFLYALLVNPGPTHFFWSAMLIYTEMSILLQYMYQIIVNHCGHDDLPLWLKKLGISGRNMNRSFVASVLPLFLVYLSTLVQSSIKARDGEWMFVTEGNTFFSCRRVYDAENQSILTSSSWKGKVWKLWTVISGACVGALKTVLRCWRSLTTGSEVPPHFVQVTLSVPRWPGDGIQPERIESAFNRLLAAVRQRDPTCNNNAEDASRVRVESLESGKDKDTALAVLEVIHAAPPNGTSVSSLLTSLTPASDVASEIMKAKHDARLEAVGFPYPILSVIAGGKKQIDLYAYIFGTDLIAFLYVALFYQSFIKNSPEFLDVYQLEDQFPKEFVFVLMTLFFLIVLDRVLYLTASAIGKVFYYFFTLVLYTSYVTSFVWGMEVKPSDRIFFQLLPLRGFYLLKALSLSLQALQLRYGLPHKSTLYEQFLMRRVNSLTWLGFRIYRALPFLFELRCVLDWSCTTTSFSMYDWLKLEDIYASLFLVQCDIKLAREKHQLGQKRSVWIKFCNGICLFFILICVIWAPMLIYSSGNPTNFVNEITEAHAQIGIRTSGGSFILYETQLCKLHSMSDIIAAGFDIDPNSSLASFDTKDVQLICCEKDANSLWLIPPPTLRNLVNTFQDGVVIISSWNFRRERPKGKEIVTFTGQPLEIGSLQGVLNGTYNSVGVENIYPRFFRLTSAGEVRVLEQTDAMVSGDLTLNREIQIWWSFSRGNASVEDGCGGVTGPLAIAVSEEVPKGLIGDTLSKFNIWSLYITFVLAVGRFIRLQCADLRMRIPYENFPSCDRLKAICEDIYAARAEGELELEEGLFWTLVKIYRSPHILMEYTKAE